MPKIAPLKAKWLFLVRVNSDQKYKLLNCISKQSFRAGKLLESIVGDKDEVDVSQGHRLTFLWGTDVCNIPAGVIPISCLDKQNKGKDKVYYKEIKWRN